MTQRIGLRKCLALTLFLSLLGWTAVSLVASPLMVVESATIIPVDGSGEYIDSGYLLVDGSGKILDVGVGEPPMELGSEVVRVDGTGKIIMPGFLSGHSHLYQSPFRGLGVHHTLLGWIYCYHMTYGPFLDSSDLYWFSKHGAMDYLGHGITTIYDWTLNNSENVDDYVDLYRGSLASGARIIFGFGSDMGKSLDENRAFLEEYLAIIEREGIDASHPRVPAVWMAGLGLLNGRERATMEFTLAREFDLPMQVHYLEEPDPTYVDIQRGLFPVYDDLEMMGPNLNFAHFINVTDEILQRTGESKTTMIWNPLSNGRLASGLPDIPHYQSFGIEVGMGIDGQASADISDPFENMRMGLYAIRMKYQNADVMMPLDVLRMHTIGTARTLGIEDQVGSLEVGKWADFIIVDPRSMETSPVINPIEHVVLTCSVANLESVYVGGEKVVDAGIFLKVDQEAVQHEVTWRLDRIQEQVDDSLEAETWDRGMVLPGLDEYQQNHFSDDHEHPRYGKARKKDGED